MLQEKRDYRKMKFQYPKKHETKEEKLERLINNFLLESWERHKGFKRYFIPNTKRNRKNRGKKSNKRK